MGKDEETVFTWFKMPINSKLSKNNANALRRVKSRSGSRKSRIGRSDSFIKARNSVYWYCKYATRGMQFEQKKIWIKWVVYKPNHRLDAINFLDGLADGIKDAIGVDDKYFSVIGDWHIDKKNPRIEVFIRQWRTNKTQP